MSFPGYPLAADKSNLTSQVTDHPGHHNDLATAVNSLQGQADSLDARVTPLEAYTVATGAYTAYTPSLVAVSLGTGGSRNGYYSRIGDTIHCYGKITFSTSGTVTPSGGIVAVGIPVSCHASSVSMPGGWMRLLIPTIGHYLGIAELGGSGNDFILMLPNDLDYLISQAYVANSAPTAGAWTANSTLHWSIHYRAQ